MSFEATPSKKAIEASNLSKCYQLYNQPKDRLKQFLWRGKRQYYRELWALRDINFSVTQGEVVGIVGQNGSGKSTLLQLVCGTLTPTSGEVLVKGRIAALLELGAGFNPEFTGRENVFMSAAIIGLSQTEIAERIDEIIHFSGIGDFIDQPVKTYSSGMYVRLAFSVAINVDPDILVIDEALSVGDGAFSRKSFNQIMKMRDAGKTILFCSHSLFQVESLCARAIWINKGNLIMDGNSADVVAAYQTFLDKSVLDTGTDTELANIATETASQNTKYSSSNAHLEKITVMIDGVSNPANIIISGQSNLTVQVNFASDPALPCPNIAVTLHAMDGRTLTSAATWEDNITLQRESNGSCQACISFEQLPLLKGEYLLSVHLLCELGLHIYDSADGVATLKVQQSGRLQGYFMMPHKWKD
ncbi:MAG: ABC transporter ATP-binding protein [Nitrosomonas sp.]|nr:ABC transporter ATP-binding protein [Nitrosomonas sp.]